ncbi:MAG: hypothetical protein ACR2HG_13870 [Pyrinomonadaceae bacterium]
MKSILIRNFRRIFSILFFVAAAAAFVHAQTDSADPNSKEDVPKNMKESLAKQRIEHDKKDFAELLERGEEAMKISDELEKSYSSNKNLSADDEKKIDRLEKVVKKIRIELGAEKDDESSDDKPLSVPNALKTLKDDTAKLVDELKKTTRYSVSVVAVESANALLRLVRFLQVAKK